MKDIYKGKMNLCFRKEKKQTIKITVKDYEENWAKLGAGEEPLPGEEHSNWLSGAKRSHR